MKNYFIAWESGSSNPNEDLDVLALHGPLTHEEAILKLNEFHLKNIKASIIQVNSIVRILK